MTCEEKRPEGIPYYYRVRGITPTPGNDWVCKDGAWVWTMSSSEKAQEPDKNKVFEEQFVVCKNPQGHHKMSDGKYHQVCKGLWGYYYIDNYEKFNLSTNWVYENITKPRLKEAVPKVDITGRAYLQDEDTGEWLGGDVGDKIVAPLTSIREQLGGIKMPSVGLPFKALGGVLVFLLVVVALLISVGYSGMGESAGRVGEKEYGKRRR